MTLKLAIDRDGLSAPDGRIAGIGATVQALRAAGFTANPYSGNRIRNIDETDATKWDSDCQPGWYLVGGVVRRSRPVSHVQQVTIDIEIFQGAVNREIADLEEIRAREAFAPHTDSGHLWSDDVLHAIAKPHVRLLSLGLAAAKRNPTAARIAAYRDGLDRFVTVATNQGLIGIYKTAIKSVWRQHRDGLVAYGYDEDTGGIRMVGGRPVMTSVAYPTGLTVVTWDTLAAVEAL